MKRLSFVVSLTNNDNDYQQEQAAAVEKAARRLGVDVKIIHANNDALAQSQQLLHYVQDSGVTRPDAIMFEPAGGTAFPQVARAAAAAGIGWVVPVSYTHLDVYKRQPHTSGPFPTPSGRCTLLTPET